MKKAIQDLPVVAPEMLAGLSAGDGLRARVLDARRASPAGFIAWRAAPVCAAALIAVAGIAALLRTPSPAEPGGAVPIDIHSAGEGQTAVDITGLRADVPGGVLSIGQGSVSDFRSLFAGKSGDFPLVGYDGRAYRMLNTPGSLSGGALGDSLGSVAYTGDPSQADSGAWYDLLSNAADADSTVYAVSGLSSSTAVAASVNGEMRLFQRFSYGGYGPAGDSLEDTLDVRGRVRALDLSGEGWITDSATANALIGTLLDNAVSKGNDVAGGKQALNIELDNGLTLQLLVSKNTLSACGAWSCPEFFEEYRAALKANQPKEAEQPEVLGESDYPVQLEQPEQSDQGGLEEEGDLFIADDPAE